ncbi:hypothetical protein DS334_15150, partial [Salmonella enterica subsp. enterica serovar Java]|nr:hypothetical protein [Salmonella enterica subsp. enterica serovar Java]
GQLNYLDVFSGNVSIIIYFPSDYFVVFYCRYYINSIIKNYTWCNFVILFILMIIALKMHMEKRRAIQ